MNTGDTILVSQHNPAMQDISQALTGSLDRDGKGGMRADLPMGGHKITNLADGTDDSDAATVGQVGSLGIPVGAVFDYAGATPPTGYLLCYGQAISRTTYAALFDAIGTAYGTGDGSTTFNLPDFRGRTSAGKDNMGGTSAGRLSTLSSTTLGATGGAQTHTLTTAQMPSHNHGVTDPGHRHLISNAIGAGSTIENGFGFDTANAFTQEAVTGITIQNAGSGQAHNNVQPTIILNKIMKVTA